VHLTVDGLNSLATILREAQPMLDECSNIISNLDGPCITNQYRSGTEQAPVPNTPVRFQPANEQPLYGIPAEIQQQGSNGQNAPPDKKQADLQPVALSASPKSRRRPGPTNRANQGFEGGVRYSDFAQPEDSGGKETTGAPGDTIAYAHRPEPDLPSSRSMKGAASELPAPPHRASRAPKPRTLPAFEEPQQVSPLLMARYDREDLYEKVWTLTMQKAAKEYGVSDVALGKTCRKLYIPVPGRGYWNKMAANQPVEPRPFLPVIRIRES
jgi:hypothetical protein